jgi:hypothetical protein
MAIARADMAVGFRIDERLYMMNIARFNGYR